MVYEESIPAVRSLCYTDSGETSVANTEYVSITAQHAVQSLCDGSSVQ